MKNLLVVFLILAILMFAKLAYPVTSSCDLALEGCVGLVHAQNTQIVHLKADIGQLEKKVNQQDSELLPWWGWMIVGGVIGGAAVDLIHR